MAQTCEKSFLMTIFSPYYQYHILWNNRSPDYAQIVGQMIDNYRKAGCKMSLKVHFLNSHLDFFPDNCGQFSEQQGERFHQDISVMENRYKGKWNTQMMADYCWGLIREDKTAHRRKPQSKTVSFC